MTKLLSYVWVKQIFIFATFNLHVMAKQVLLKMPERATPGNDVDF